MVDEAIELYNEKRLHKSLQMHTPNEAHIKQNHQYATYRKQRKSGTIVKQEC